MHVGLVGVRVEHIYDEGKSPKLFGKFKARTIGKPDNSLDILILQQRGHRLLVGFATDLHIPHTFPPISVRNPSGTCSKISSSVMEVLLGERHLGIRSFDGFSSTGVHLLPFFRSGIVGSTSENDGDNAIPIDEEDGPSRKKGKLYEHGWAKEEDAPAIPLYDA